MESYTERKRAKDVKVGDYLIAYDRASSHRLVYRVLDVDEYRGNTVIAIRSLVSIGGKIREITGAIDVPADTVIEWLGEE